MLDKQLVLINDYYEFLNNYKKVLSGNSRNCSPPFPVTVAATICIGIGSYIENSQLQPQQGA
jgi:hypothetical protein